MTAKTRPSVKIDVVVTDSAWSKALPKAALLGRRAARSALRADPASRRRQRPSPVELALCLADDRTVRRLNKDYRGKDKPTNVLSFPTLDIGSRGAAPGRRRHLGDVILALGTLRREAKKQKKTLAAHYCHLVVHGVLHLLGFDHDSEAKAEIMEGWERSVLADLGYQDPYR